MPITQMFPEKDDTETDREAEEIFTASHAGPPALAGSPAGSHAAVFAILPTFCYGSNNSVDSLELCGGKGGIAQIAFRRGLSSGGNLDKLTSCDLGNPQVQRLSFTTSEPAE